MFDWQHEGKLVVETLGSGPADGHEILQHAKTKNIWEALYVASRSSSYAPEWRESFGKERSSYYGNASVLKLAVAELHEQVVTMEDLPSHEQERAQVSFIARLIANCCADSKRNRRTVLFSKGLLSLLKLLEQGADPNILVPTIYNVCADLDEHSEQVMQGRDHVAPPPKVEEELARSNVPSKSIYSGIIAFLSPTVVLQCNDDTKEYLADLIEMSARPAATIQEDTAASDNSSYGHALERLLAPDGGRLLVDHSAKCLGSIARSILAISTSAAARSFLASNGSVFVIARIVDDRSRDQEYFGDDEEEQQENKDALETIKMANLKLVYEICQLPQFLVPPKYGIARQSLDIICNNGTSSSYALAIASIVLYGFVDNDARAHLLVNESLLPPLIEILAYATDRTVIHPALALATRLAVTWPLKAELHKANAMQAVRRLLTAASLGYEIPLNTATFFELLVKGHPSHILTMIDRSGGQSIVDDVFVLFDKGHDAICIEVGRLIIEMCATLAQQSDQGLPRTEFGLDDFAASCKPDTLSRLMVYVATRAHSDAPAAAQRVWFVLGLLSTIPNGRTVVHLALQNADVQSEMRRIESEGPSAAASNIKFMMFNLDSSQSQILGGPISSLHGAMNQLSLG